MMLKLPPKLFCMHVFDIVFSHSFYGVIISSAGDCNEVTDFGLAYPDPQPRSQSNDANYYIAAGWDDTSEIPSQFTAGNGRDTTARRLGEEETYTNPGLDSSRRYCIVAFAYLDSGVEDVSPNRILWLNTC